MRVIPTASLIGASLLLVCCGSDRASVAGCGDGAVIEDGVLRVATSVSPITDIVARIAEGTSTVVEGVVPEGVDSHTYEPTPSTAATLERSDIVFLNGLGLEEPTRELATANLLDGAELCELGTTVLPEADYIYDRSFPESGGVPNPHVWTDPPLALDMAVVATEVMSVRDPANADGYRANLDVFRAEVERLDAALSESTATLAPERRLLLTYHDAYAYFAADYGWTVVAAVQPSTFDEPSPREVAALIEQIRTLGVTAIFGSEVFPSPVLEQIAAESGAAYVGDLRDDDLPGETGDPEHSWFELMRTNYVTIIDSLGGDASALTALGAQS